MKKLLFILISILMIFSCTDEVSIYPEEVEDNDIIYTTGQLQVYLENPEITTRANTWDYDDYFPNADIYHDDSKQERWRHSVSIAYFDSDFLLEIFNTPEITNLTNSTGIASDIYADNTILHYSALILGVGSLPITTGAHYFYVLANLPPYYIDYLEEYCKNRVGELTKDEFEKIILKDHTIEDIAGVELYSNSGDLKRRCLMTPMTSPAPYYMAPYDLIIGSGSYPEVNGVDTKIGKAFAKVAVAYIPLPEQSKGRLTDVNYRIINDPKETYLFSNIFKGQVHTPHYEKTIENDDFDAYFTAYFNPNSHIEKTFPDSTNFSWRAATLTPEDQKNYAYCMENGNKTPLQGNSTMVLVRAQYIPDEWLNPDKTPGTEALDGTFWRIRNTATGAYSSGYYNDEPLVFGTQEAVRYPGGITYYPIWLETDGKYMVKRNHYYKIAITEVLSAGAPDLPSVMDPAKPLGNSVGDNSLETRSAGSENDLPEIAKCIRWEQNY